MRSAPANNIVLAHMPQHSLERRLYHFGLHGLGSGQVMHYSRKSADTTSNYFVDQPPSIAQGGRRVVVPGCPACMKRINTMSQFLDHLADDVLPALIEKLSVNS